MKRTARSRIVLAAALSGLLIAAACGDDDDDSGSSDSSGSPIKIMNWTAVDNPSYSSPDTKAGAEARVRAINESGGINGRQLELEFCNSNFDPNGEASCARKAVDEGFVAVVGSTSFFPNTLPLLERAGVPYVGGYGVNVAELQSPVSFPLSSATPGFYQGSIALALERGAQRVSIVTSPVANAEFGARLAEEALRSAGIEPLRTVTAPLAAPDLSAAAAEAADGADAVVLAAVPTDAIKIVQSLRQGNYGGLIAGPMAYFTDDAISILGAAAEGVLASGQVAPPTSASNPAVAQFVEDIDAVAPDEQKGERSMVAWGAVELFAKVVEGIDGDVTTESVLRALTDLSDPVDVGITGPYSTTGEVALPDYPRIFNATVAFAEVRGGRLVQISDGFVNPFEQLKSRAGR